MLDSEKMNEYSLNCGEKDEDSFSPDGNIVSVKGGPQNINEQYTEENKSDANRVLDENDPHGGLMCSSSYLSTLII